MSKNKLAGIISGCVVAIVVIAVIATNTPTDTPQVEYKITGTASQVDVTLQNATGGIEQHDNASVPHSYAFNAFTGWFLYISAQNQGGYGSVTVSIYLNGRIVATSTSSGAYVIASASYSRL